MGQTASVPQPGTKFQVIGAGLPRTGTASFSRALEILFDAPVFHCGTQATLGPTSQIKRWKKILRCWLAGADSDKQAMFEVLHQQMDGYSAITDSPGSQFVPELMELYPDAKVVCTIRDPVAWEKSMDQVRGQTVPWWLPIVLLPLPGLTHFIPYLYLLAAQYERLYEEKIPTRETYHRHIAWLQKVVPEDRLLLFDVKEGWEPLCKALGKDIPEDQPFPHVNDSDAMLEISRIHVRRGLTHWAVILAVGAAAVAWTARR
ncbi:NAD dependent epimerase/dehydratase [Penicillium macrosclerotiorum]|uniref:NAD dependent epimerase/dehydratase n=1 Tax=Penicillium macrosclerotiorum TaxID=303699 RepID=UPI00254989B9|nr:NAD dependent epimerase/dehydratase [Penicillium macrosclerotiorum]KAJ5682729.1 NAD dependent epimerase/dehydratase [Penicillium macrosclerotiorum]